MLHAVTQNKTVSNKNTTWQEKKRQEKCHICMKKKFMSELELVVYSNYNAVSIYVSISTQEIRYNSARVSIVHD